MSRNEVFRLRLGPSRRLAAALSVAHALGAIGVIASPLPSIVAGLLLLTLSGSLAFHLRRDAWLLSRSSLVLLELSDTLDFVAEDRSGSRLVGTVLGTTFVSPWLVVINLRVEQSRFRRALVVMPDATDQQSFRAVRVWLRWRQPDVRHG
jgi:toxin CptA